MLECPACLSSRVGEPTDYLNGAAHRDPIFNKCKIVSCDDCETAWVPNPPTQAELSRYYATSYKPARPTDEWPINDPRAMSLILFGRALGHFRKGGLFVDLGPGNGAALSLAPHLLQSPKVGCVEFNEGAISKFKERIPDIAIRDSVAGFGAGSINMLYSAHCLEHFLPDEIERELKSCLDALIPKGIFAVEVPRAMASRAKTQRRHTPHLLFFSRKGFISLLKRVGFRIAMARVFPGRRTFGKKVVNKRFNSHELTKSYNTGDLIPLGPREANDPKIEGVLKVIAIKR